MIRRRSPNPNRSPKPRHLDKTHRLGKSNRNAHCGKPLTSGGCPIHRTSCLYGPFCEAEVGGTGVTGNGQRARTRSKLLYSPVLEEEDLAPDLRDAIKNNVLFADLRSDGAESWGGAGASVNVRGGPWRRTCPQTLASSRGSPHQAEPPKLPTQPAKGQKK